MQKRIKELIILTTFLLLMFALPVLMIFYKNDSNTENRTLADYPVLSVNNIQNFPSEAEAYLNDHIPFKSNITKLYSLLMTGVFRTSTQKSVILGENDFYFYHSIYKGDHDTMADYSGRGWYTEDQLEEYAKRLNAIKEKVENQGADFYFMICPNKSTVYCEYVPECFKIVSQKHKADQLVEYLENNTDIKIIYPKEALLKNKEENLLYYKKDTHWNDLGAFVGEQELINIVLGEEKTSLNSLFIREQKIHSEVQNKILLLDLSNMLSLNGNTTDYLYDICNYKKEISTTEKYEDDLYMTRSTSENGKLMFQGDSFSYSLRPILSKDFSEVYYDSNGLNKVKEVGADYFIYECVERNLDNVLER